MVREFLAADVEGVESIGAVGAVFEQVFLGFGEFFAGLVLAEAVAPSADAGRLDSKDKVGVVGAIEEWHQALLTAEALVDEKRISHRGASGCRDRLPPRASRAARTRGLPPNGNPAR